MQQNASRMKRTEILIGLLESDQVFLDRDAAKERHYPGGGEGDSRRYHSSSEHKI